MYFYSFWAFPLWQKKSIKPVGGRKQINDTAPCRILRWGAQLFLLLMWKAFLRTSICRPWRKLLRTVQTWEWSLVLSIESVNSPSSPKGLKHIVKLTMPHFFGTYSWSPSSYHLCFQAQASLEGHWLFCIGRFTFFLEGRPPWLLLFFQVSWMETVTPAWKGWDHREGFLTLLPRVRSGATEEDLQRHVGITQQMVQSWDARGERKTPSFLVGRSQQGWHHRHCLLTGPAHIKDWARPALPRLRPTAPFTGVQRLKQ